jgi:parallel beta-helix repeat protein
MYRSYLFIVFILVSIVFIASLVEPGRAQTGSMTIDDVPGKKGPGSIIIEDNKIYQNNLVGIRIRGNSPVTIKKCQIYSNGETGVLFDTQAQAVLSDSSVFENGRAGINILDSGRIIIENNRIYKHLLGGVRILGTTENEKHKLMVRVAGNRIYLNKRAGIRAMPLPIGKIDLAVVGNRIYQNETAGLRVENNIRLTAVGNQVHDNMGAGIIVHESVIQPEFDIYQNRISFNNGEGIQIVNGITGQIGISNNWIYSNYLSGIGVGLFNSPISKLDNIKIMNNTIVSNGSGYEGSGIRSDSKGEVIIMNNIVAYNYLTGIRTEDCGGYSYNLLYANGETGDCCADPGSAPFRIEWEQFAGCPGRKKGDLIGNPLFVDPDNYNFYLQDKSPAIGAGKDVYQDSNTSFYRNDMGATGGPYAENITPRPDSGSTY